VEVLIVSKVAEPIGSAIIFKYICLVIPPPF